MFDKILNCFLFNFMFEIQRSEDFGFLGLFFVFRGVFIEEGDLGISCFKLYIVYMVNYNLGCFLVEFMVDIE